MEKGLQAMTKRRLTIGDSIKCGSSREWIELRARLEQEGWILDFKPNMTIEIIGFKEE